MIDDKNARIRSLLSWYRANGRQGLPWRDNPTPYNVLVSELMLQQTQVVRVIPKYNAFLKRFPTIHALADAPRQDVLDAWQGLGYNSRAVRLHALAKVISTSGATLPQTFDALAGLPGIGPYTAGAIICFAYNKPAPSVDVNVRRVFTRWHGIEYDATHLAGLALEYARASGNPRIGNPPSWTSEVRYALHARRNAQAAR